MALESRFSASAFWPAMIRNEATVIYLLGAMVPILLAGEARADERGHKVRTGLGPGVPANLGSAFTERTGVQLLEGYGSTETNFVIASPGMQKPGTMGRIVDGFQARVVDPQDVEVPPGEAGELVLRADEPFAFASGYFGMPEKTIEAWRNLWFHTGDRVMRDEDGYFRFVDRLKDAIRRRGENISSYEVEQVLLAHPDIDMVAVFPVRSELAEDEVMAAIVTRAGAAIRPGRADAVLRGAATLFRGAPVRRLHRRPAANRERQGPEIRAARARRDRFDLGPRSVRLPAEAGRQIMPSYLTLKISPPSIGSGPAWARRSAVEPEEMRHG